MKATKIDDLNQNRVETDEDLDDVATVAVRSPFAQAKAGTLPSIDVRTFDPKRRIMPGQFSKEISEFFEPPNSTNDQETIIAPEPSPLKTNGPSTAVPASSSGEIDETVYWDESPVAKFKAIKDKYARTGLTVSPKIIVTTVFSIILFGGIYLFKPSTAQTEIPKTTPAANTVTQTSDASDVSAAPEDSVALPATPKESKPKPVALETETGLVLKEAIDALLEGRLEKSSMLYQTLATRNPDDETLALTLKILSRIEKEAAP